MGQIAGTVLLLAVAGLVLATPGGAYVGQADPGPPPADDTTLIPPAALAGDELEDVDRLLPDPADGVFTVEGERNRTLVDVPPDAAEKLDEQLLDVADLLDRDLIADDGTVPVVLDAARAPAARLLDDPTRHEPFGLTSGRVAYPAIVDLARAPGVDHVHLDDRLQLQLDESVETVRADRLHEQRTDEGATITGDGVRIAIIDSGVDYAHERLGGCFGDGCKVAEGADYIEEDGDPMDEYGHGTHVAATAAGTRGVAPDATIHAYRVCDAGCPLSALLAAIEDAVEDDADVLSMSLGGPGTVDGPLASAADWAVDQGVPVVSAAGNSYGRWTVGEPAASLKGIAVGATNGDGGIAFFSSRGPVVDANGTVAGFKPDVAAPGVDVDAAVPTGDCPLCHPSGERELSGTSMATPHVSGAAALLLQAHPDWSPEQVKAALTGGAEDLGEHALAQGRGRLDALAAWNATVGLLPATAWTGIDLPTNDTYRTAPELTVHNLDDRQRQVDLEDETPAGAWVGFEPASATLSAGGNATVQANLTVDNDAIPEGFHALDVTATADGTTSRAGLGFAHYHVLELDLDPDTNVVATYRGGDVRHLVSGPPEDLRLLAPSGTYDAAAFVDGCPADVDRCEDRSRSIALAEDRVPRGVLDLTLERSPAMHAVGYEASLLDGSSMPPEARHCSLADDTTACFGQWRDQLFPVGATSLLGYVGYGHDRTRYLDGASEEIVYGASLAYRHDGVDYAGGNATRGVQGDTTLTPTPLQTWEVGRELPPSYEEGAHRQRCYHAAYEATFDGGLQPTPWNGFAWDLGEAWVPVDGDGTQTVAFGGPAPDPVDWGTQRVGGVAAYPCQMVRQTVEAGEHEDRICRDDRGCPAVATSLYQDPHGGDPLQREPEYWLRARCVVRRPARPRRRDDPARRRRPDLRRLGHDRGHLARAGRAPGHLVRTRQRRAPLVAGRAVPGVRRADPGDRPLRGAKRRRPGRGGRAARPGSQQPPRTVDRPAPGRTGPARRHRRPRAPRRRGRHRHLHRRLRDRRHLPPAPPARLASGHRRRAPGLPVRRRRGPAPVPEAAGTVGLGRRAERHPRRACRRGHLPAGPRRPPHRPARRRDRAGPRGDGARQVRAHRPDGDRPQRAGPAPPGPRLPRGGGGTLLQPRRPRRAAGAWPDPRPRGRPGSPPGGGGARPVTPESG